MKRQHGVPLIVASLAIGVCCCVLAAVSAGLLSWQAIRAALDLRPATAEQGPPPQVIRRPPTPAEQETARLAFQASLPQRDLADLAHRLRGVPLGPDRPPETPPLRELGDRETFWVQNSEDDTFFTATAILAYATPHAYWWVEQGYQVPSADLERSARRFEDHTYPTNRRLFGSEPDPGVDGDPHLYIFLGNVPGVGGYFAGPDEYPARISAHSNEHEMFYVNLENVSPGDEAFDGILAHEFQHMIQWAADRNEDAWVAEGLAELAAQVNGYDAGASDTAFLASPDTQLNTWPELEDSPPHYGASHLFVTYSLERYGEDAVRQLVAEAADGIAGFEAVLQRVDPDGRRFDDLFAEWAVANYLDDVRPADGRYGYADLDLWRPGHAARHTAYPARGEATVAQYGTDYILLDGAGPFTVEFTGSLLVPLVGNQPHSGDYQWWSNRGDDGDATLTRSFDLAGLGRATLHAWMWYDLEDNYDYAYVEMSIDGGETWTLLANEHTVSTSPTGNNLGSGFTGHSGDGGGPAWSLETFDLTPYVGRRALLRFEVVTDDSLNHPGLCLDDLSIPEIGYRDDVEGGAGGWQAEGWVRVTGYVPQRFAVQLIALGREPQVLRLDLGDDQHGTLTLSRLGRAADRAVLVVSGLTPVTTARASYRYRVYAP